MGLRGRPRKPTNVLELTGHFKHNPYKRKLREGEPKPSRFIDATPPTSLDPGQQECYREIVNSCPARVLSAADKVMVEIVACLLDEFRVDKGNMSGAKLVRLMAGLSLLGMTPSDRSKVATLKGDDEENPYAEFGT